MVFNKLPIERMSAEEIAEARDRVSIKDPQKLIKFLERNGPVIPFVVRDLVTALSYSDDATKAFQSIVNLYMSYRITQPNGDFEEVKNPLTGEIERVPQTKTEVLTLTEMDRAIRNLIGQAKDLDPRWSLDNPPL